MPQTVCSMSKPTIVCDNVFGITLQEHISDKGVGDLSCVLFLIDYEQMCGFVVVAYIGQEFHQRPNGYLSLASEMLFGNNNIVSGLGIGIVLEWFWMFLVDQGLAIFVFLCVWLFLLVRVGSTRQFSQIRKRHATQQGHSQSGIVLPTNLDSENGHWGIAFRILMSVSASVPLVRRSDHFRIGAFSDQGHSKEFSMILLTFFLVWALGFGAPGLVNHRVSNACFSHRTRPAREATREAVGKAAGEAAREVARAASTAPTGPTGSAGAGTMTRRGEDSRPHRLHGPLRHRLILLHGVLRHRLHGLLRHRLHGPRPHRRLEATTQGLSVKIVHRCCRTFIYSGVVSSPGHFLFCVILGCCRFFAGHLGFGVKLRGRKTRSTHHTVPPDIPC
jgi:hypothetical protein